jgi:hypothetical protein
MDVIETWQTKRVPLASAFTRDGLREFSATHNALARRMMSLFDDRRDPEFYSALLELAQQCSTISVKAKFVVEGKDRTNV